MKRDAIDFFLIADGHALIHGRLEEWARWVKVHPHGWQTHPMFKGYRSHAWQWERPEVQTPINTLRAAEMEKAVGALPEKQMWAIRWNYVFNGGPLVMARKLGVSMDGLQELVTQGRTMLKNRMPK